MNGDLRQAIGLANSVIMVADKFIGKVDSGRARSVETYSDLQKLRAEALLLKKAYEEILYPTPTN